MPDRSEEIPEGPTDPRLSMGDDQTTIMSPPGYGQPGSLIPPPPPPPPTAPVSVPPVTGEPFGGRVYTAGEARPPEPEVEPAAEEPTPSDVVETSDRGATTIDDEVVKQVIDKIASLAVDEVDGVHGLLRTSPQDDRPEDYGPVEVQLDGDEVKIDVVVSVEFGYPIRDVADKVRGYVIGQAERLLGISVTEMNVLIGGVSIESTL
jgi:uncharacterized alkaline shock family protein YloU